MTDPTANLDQLLDQPASQPIPTGLADLDQLFLGGLRPGEFIVVAGYPGMGSSSFARGLARSAAVAHGHGTYIASLESTATQTARWLLAAETPTLLNAPLASQPSDRVAQARARLKDAPLHVTEGARDLDAVRRVALRLDESVGLRMLVVDGAHLLVPAHDYGGRAQFADDFARDLKEFAIEFGVTVVVALPLEFPFGTRESNVPLLRDLGKRQSFAAAADVVVLIHREDYYDHQSPRSGEADLIVAKSRNSERSFSTVAFQRHYGRFIDMRIAS